MAWTRFTDAFSGGDPKLEFETIFIECGEDEATDRFQELFGRDPYHVSCRCCGQDYTWWECEAATVVAAEKLASPKVKVVYASEPDDWQEKLQLEE